MTNKPWRKPFLIGMFLTGERPVSARALEAYARAALQAGKDEIRVIPSDEGGFSLAVTTDKLPENDDWDD